jgi:YgjP-like, metallopeptidase domain
VGAKTAFTLLNRPDLQVETEALTPHTEAMCVELLIRFGSCGRIQERWEPRLQVEVNGHFLQRMKTKWGSCNNAARNIRLNTELVEKPKDLLEYVVVHEMAHLIEPSHSSRFVAILDEHYPTWRDAGSELNDLPLAAETWRE